ncbi:hypothetical protein BPMI_00813 [Candidatus Burkholderia pumila]|uniref:Thioesterase domain-containing protein n=1 Tax=Candidatus Burkholderia pumila TaxID=1090375 RepID=A0ABR5HL23_9BURK|nr:hypothetical protein BPMI_00813 [Candidatus Burkholderia pumila]
MKLLVNTHPTDILDVDHLSIWTGVCGRALLLDFHQSQRKSEWRSCESMNIEGIGGNHCGLIECVSPRQKLICSRFFRLRHQVLAEELHWVPQVNSGFEQDQYDIRATLIGIFGSDGPEAVMQRMSMLFWASARRSTSPGSKCVASTMPQSSRKQPLAYSLASRSSAGSKTRWNSACRVKVRGWQHRCVGFAHVLREISGDLAGRHVTSKPPYSHYRALVEPLRNALTPRLDAPYTIYGHSLGALLGFGLAHALHDTGADPFVSRRISGHRIYTIRSTTSPAYRKRRSSMD